MTNATAGHPGARTPIVVRLLRIGFAALCLLAIVWIPIRNAGDASFSVVNYFSYFTILSNVLSVIVLAVGGILDPDTKRWQLIRGAVTLYMVITCIVYAILLANVDVMLTDQWINYVLHRLIPIVLLLDWVIVPPRPRLDDSECLSWLAFPLVYGVYSLIRGEFVEWYAYPFLDPRQQGYVSLVIGLIVLSVAMVLMALAVGALGRLAARWRYRTQPQDTVG